MHIANFFLIEDYKGEMWMLTQEHNSNVIYHIYIYIYKQCFISLCTLCFNFVTNKEFQMIFVLFKSRKDGRNVFLDLLQCFVLNDEETQINGF